MRFLNGLAAVERTPDRLATVATGAVLMSGQLLGAIHPAFQGLDKIYEALVITAESGWLDSDKPVDVGTISRVENLSGKGVAVFQQINTLAMKLRAADRGDRPGEIPEADVAGLAMDLEVLHGLAMSWGTELDNAMPTINAALRSGE